MIYLVSFIIALGFSLCLLLILIYTLTRLNITDQPRSDRWHRSPRPKFGGVGIFLGTMIAFYITYRIYPASEPLPLTLLVSMVLMFLFGLFDDIKQLTPIGKLITQIIAASVAVFFGYTTNFFTPRLGETFLAQILNSGVSLFWLVAVTNAMNLLDNMDGLAGGISLIVCLFMGYFFWDSREGLMILFCSALAGAILGFLLLNFPPAKIFMGDNGSQFLGFTLGLLAIARQPQASNVFAIVGVPTLLFTLPLLDTLFVTITRWLRGDSPFRGGRDHTSHRLIAFGLSERQTLLVLYAIAIVGGLTAMVVESLNYLLSLTLLPLIILFLFVFTTYLAGIKIAEQDHIQQEGIARKILIKFFLGRSLLEVVLDSVLISFGFYLSILFGAPGSTNEQLEDFIQNLPLALISGYLSFFLMRIYRDLWRHFRGEIIYRYIQAALLSSAILWAIRLIFPASRIITFISLLIFGMFIFVGLILTRFSFQALDLISHRTRTENAQRVLLYAPLETLDYLIPYFIASNGGNYHLIGLVIDQEYQVGKRILDLQILGKAEQLRELIQKHKVQGLFVDGSKAKEPAIQQSLQQLIEEKRCWVSVVALDLIDFEEFLTMNDYWRNNDSNPE